MHILRWIKKKIAWFFLGGVALAAGTAILTTPEIVPDANPVLRTERRFNDSVSVVKRNVTETDFSDMWLNYYSNGEWLAIDTTLVQTPDGFCADKMPFKFCAPLRSTGEAVFTANNQYDIFGMKIITDAPLEERMMAVGVNDVPGQLMTGNLMTPGGRYEADVQYVLYPGAYDDADLVYKVVPGSAPHLAQLVMWNAPPACSQNLTRTFISKYSAPVEITNFETGVKWNKTGQFQTTGEPLDIVVSENRGAGKKPFRIWDSKDTFDKPGQLVPNKVQRVNVKITTAPGQNAYALTKILPCDFFTGVVYPVYTDTDTDFSPQASAGTITGDATTQHSQDAMAWADIRAAAGNAANDAAVGMPVTINDQEAAGSGFKVGGAIMMSFNTPATIPTTDDVTAAVLKLKVISKTSPTDLNALNMVVTKNIGTWTESIVGTDFDTRDASASSTVYSNYVLYGDINADDIESFTLNTTALADIAKGSANCTSGNCTRFSIQSHLDMANTPVPATSNNSTENGDEVRFQSADNTTAPVLTVTHVAGAAVGGVNEEETLPGQLFWNLYDLKVAVYYGLTDFISTAYAALK